MTEHPNSEPSSPSAPAPGEDHRANEPEEAIPTPPHERPSEAATADIEERQDAQRAKEREAGRPPSDAPAY